MNHLNSFGLYFCAAATGAQLSMGNYKLAFINVLGILFFYFIKRNRE